MRTGIPALVMTALLACGAAPTAAGAGEGHAALARQLGDDSFKKREAALRQLVKLGQVALPALRKAAKSPDPEVRWRAQTAGRMIRWSVSPELAEKIGNVFAGFEDMKWFERERLVMDLAAVGGKAALPTLVRVLTRAQNESVRRAAAVRLLRMGPEGLLALEKCGAKSVHLPPDDPALRIQIGNGFLEEGRYARAAEQYRRAIRLAPQNATAWYNLACVLSRLEKIKQAVKALRKAVDCGFDDLEWLKKDPDLDNLRAHRLYTEFIRSLEKE